MLNIFLFILFLIVIAYHVNIVIDNDDRVLFYFRDWIVLIKKIFFLLIFKWVINYLY